MSKDKKSEVLQLSEGFNQNSALEEHNEFTKRLSIKLFKKLFNGCDSFNIKGK